MDPKSNPCIFFGYLDDVKGKKLPNTTTHELFIKRIVQFGGLVISSSTTSFTITFETLHHDNSSSKDINPPYFDGESSLSTLDGNNDDEFIFLP